MTSTRVRPGLATPMLHEVARGLALPQKELPSKYFYDHRGSELFEAITELPEYYPTRTERAILAGDVPALLSKIRPATLIELGAGSAAKTRIILDAMRHPGETQSYVPLDVSASFLAQTALRVRAEYPGLQVEPVAADFTERIPDSEPYPHPALFAFLGSTIGNFAPIEAARILSRVRLAMHTHDSFLLGADLQKDESRLIAAYDDRAGVTAEFNLNILRVLNRELGADFALDGFRHLARYNRSVHRIEMHLVSVREQCVQVPGAGTYHFAIDETIRTEISCKYDRGAVSTMLASAGLRLDRWFTDSAGDFALALAVRADAP